MPRRTLSLPDYIDEVIRLNALEGESYSATVARLVHRGAEKRPVPEYVGSGESNVPDLALRAEEYLAEILDEEYRAERPG